MPLTESPESPNSSWHEKPIKAAVAEFVGHSHFQGTLTQEVFSRGQFDVGNRVFSVRLLVPAVGETYNSFTTLPFRKHFPAHTPRIKIASPYGVVVTFVPKIRSSTEEFFEIVIYFDPEKEPPLIKPEEDPTFWARLRKVDL